MKVLSLFVLAAYLFISCERKLEKQQLEPIAAIPNVTISVNPNNVKQKLVFGGDTKLTIKQWAEGPTDLISKQLFQDINLDILRIPIFTRIDIKDPIYDQVGQVVKSVQKYNPAVQIFASVANGNGYEENNLHREEKFPDSWIGCCPEHVYKMDLEKFIAYLDAFMLRMKFIDVPIHFLGPYNEDKAFSLDYNTIYENMKDLGGTKKVNLERYSLAAAVDEQAKIGDNTDIVGSHYFDDQDPAKGIRLWNQLVKEAKHPVWFTESTRFKNEDSNENLMNGLNHIFPAINAGVKAVIFYQVFPRFVTEEGSALPSKYTGFKTFINSFKDAQVIESNSSDTAIRCIANANDDHISIHLLNYHSTEKIAQVNLTNVNVSVAKQLSWTNQAIMKTINVQSDERDQFIITLPPNSYVSIEVENIL